MNYFFFQCLFFIRIIVTVNLQSASNNANNENMATAGRRRTLKRLEKLKNFAEATGLGGGSNVKSKIRVGFKPIHIKHLKSRKKRKESDLEAVAEEASLVALSYMDLFLNISTYQKSLQQSEGCIARLFCCASKAASSIGNLGRRLAFLFSQTTFRMLHLDPVVLGEAHTTGLGMMSSCQKFKCKMESSLAKMKFCHN